VAADGVHLVVNAGAREGSDALDRARRALAAAGLQVAAAVRLDDPEALEGALREGLDRGVRRFVVGGGDGTLGAAAGVLAPAGAVLSVLPLGTANDFARALHIPRDLAAAAAIAARGAVREVDLGRAGGRIFLNAASFGLSGGVTRRVSDGLKRRAGPLAYPVAAVAEAAALSPFRLTLEADGERRELDALQVVVGNGRFHGGGRLVAPGARLDDRRLDVYVVAAASEDASDPGAGGRLRDLVSLARYAALLRHGRHLEHPGVWSLRTGRVVLSADPPQEIDADGELAGTTPAEFRLAGPRLRVTAPRPRDDAAAG
jgi:YegS/Rv2252/BmrU family lipid kinase